MPVVTSSSSILSLPVNQWTGTMEGTWRGHGGDMEGTFIHPHIIPHIIYWQSSCCLPEQRCWVSLVSARRASLTNGVAPPLTLLHSALCSGQSKRCKVAYNIHWRRTHTHTYTHIPGSQSCNNKQTCIGCTSSVTYTQSWALHAIHNVITHSELLKQCSQIEPLVSSTLQCAIGSALSIVAPADIDTLVKTPRPIPSTVRSSSDGGSPTTADSFFRSSSSIIYICSSLTADKPISACALSPRFMSNPSPSSHQSNTFPSYYNVHVHWALSFNIIMSSHFTNTLVDNEQDCYENYDLRNLIVKNNKVNNHSQFVCLWATSTSSWESASIPAAPRVTKWSAPYSLSAAVLACGVCACVCVRGYTAVQWRACLGEVRYW